MAAVFCSCITAHNWVKKRPSHFAGEFCRAEIPAGNLFKRKWRFNKANVHGFLCADNGIDWPSILQMTHVNDQWYQIKKLILLLEDRFVPFGPVPQRRKLP